MSMVRSGSSRSLGTIVSALRFHTGGQSRTSRMNTETLTKKLGLNPRPLGRGVSIFRTSKISGAQPSKKNHEPSRTNRRKNSPKPVQTWEHRGWPRMLLPFNGQECTKEMPNLAELR